MNKTKIVCTLGPATADDAVLRELMKSGMNVARQNFSHGDHESHTKTFKQVKRIREELNLPIASLLDTNGPEVRVKTFREGKVTLVDKQTFTLTTEEVEGTSEFVSITYKGLANDIDIGTSILLDDGMIELKVTDIVQNGEETDIITRVVHGGVLSDRKSANFPGIKLSLPYISTRDRGDIIFGAKLGFDYIAASFVRRDEDILEIRKILEENNCSDVRIIAKIENQEGVDNIEDIIRVSDGIMVARGDMGVEIAFEELPRIQKELIRKAYFAGKPVITATQMLESMVTKPRPTRAETTDVANAIYDGTSALMLSGETAAGAFPVEALRTMVKIAERTEKNIDYTKRFRTLECDLGVNVTNAIAHATVTTALDLRAEAILTVTHGGNTARLLSKFRSCRPVLGCTPSKRTWRQLGMSWGVVPILTEEKDRDTSYDELLHHAVDRAVEEGHLENGDLVVITAGVPLGVSGTTNLMKVQTVGDVLVSGSGVTKKSITAPLCVALTDEEALESFENGDILVMPKTDNKLMRVLRSAGGLIVEEEGLDSHAAIVGLTLDIPVIVGAKNATKILKSGVAVTLDANKGMVLN
ncbi:MAG: pyruvate kinase [Oscillospiraceae bacterium]|jgi:pyruvate kinase|nr:pyruvate kinase [Oscillospiraceae bacterium]